MDINVNNLQVSNDGRVSFSGLSSKIDFQGAVDGIMQARRIPVDSLETRVEENEAKMAGFRTARTYLNSLKDSLSSLYGAVSADSSRNIFEAKQAYASSSRSDGGMASSASDIMGVSVTSSAEAGSHTIEVVQTARSHRVGSGTFTSRSEDLATARGLPANSISGEIEIAGRTITVQGSDTLNDLASRINAANSGNDATGVSASVIQVADGQHVLALTVDETGQTLGDDVSLADPDGVLEQIGVLTADDEFANELQSARTARFYADGVLDSGRHISDLHATSGSSIVATGGTLTFSDENGNLIGTLDYSAGASLDDLRNAINGDATLAAAGITAAIESVGGGYRLAIEGEDGFRLSDSGSAADDTGLSRDRLLFERSSNTIDDLFRGVTLSLFRAEPGTEIQLDIERDLSQVKSAIKNFVEAYNGLKQFMNAQLDTDPATGEPREDAALFGSRGLSDVDRRISQILGTGAEGLDAAFSVLAQIGIDFVDNRSVDDPTLVNTLEISEEKLDEALLNNPHDVRKLFQFDFSSSDARVSLLGFRGTTSHSESGYSLDVTVEDGIITGATVDGEEAVVSGNRIEVVSGPARGLQLHYSGDSSAQNIQLDFTVGLGANMFFEVDRMLDEDSGIIESELDNLTTVNEQHDKRIEEMLRRLDIQRENLIDRFIRMETALSSMNNILEQVTSMTDAMFADR